MRYFAALCALAIGLASLGQIETKADRLIHDKMMVSEWTVQALTLPRTVQPTVLVPINLGGQAFTLKLWPHASRSKDFKLLIQDRTGLHEEPAAAPSTCRGTVLGVDGSAVSGSIDNNQFTGLVVFNFTGKEPGPEVRYSVVPLSQIDPTAAKPLHVVADSSNLLPTPFHCGVTEGSRDNDGDEVIIQATGEKICDIAFDSDYEFYQKNGSSVPNTMKDIENVMNTVEFVYERDVDITYEVTTIVVRTIAADPYTSTDPNTILTEFQNAWNSGMGLIRRDTAHMMTGKAIDGNVIGISFVGVICNTSYGYGLDESRFSSNFDLRVALSAHEIGHNWNASHCSGSDCHIMCPTINQCGGVTGSNLKFGAAEQSEIETFRATLSCLTTEPDFLSPPFSDAFPTSLIDSNKWVYVYGATAPTTASNEPSPSNSLDLDATVSADYADDEIRTHFINLSGLSGHIVSFWIEHIGVESGESLSVEYWNKGQLRWDVLTTVASDGVDQTNFTYTVVGLPAAAYTTDFRLRFVAVVNEPNDDWYIDNVYVGAPLTATVQGNVDLQSIAISPYGQSATIEFRSPKTTNLAFSGPVSLDGNGNYGIAGVPIGVYDVAVKFPTWLRQVLPSRTIASPSTSGVNFSLVCGDAVEDNSVDLLDLNRVLTNFGGFGEGDVDLSGLVDLLDLNTIMANFLMAGQP